MPSDDNNNSLYTMDTSTRKLDLFVVCATIACLILSDFGLVSDFSKHLQHPTTLSQPTPQSSPQSVVIYSHLRKDRSGWVIMDMLKAHAYAWERNATYGGACGDSQHKEDIQNILDSTGLGSSILSLECPPNATAEDDNIIIRHVLYKGSLYETGSAKRLTSDAWKRHVQSQLHFEEYNNTTNIVVHIRRGDVTPCCYLSWYVPNSYFEAMIDKHSRQAKRQYPERDVSIQIFSQEDSFESFAPFRQFNLHLDSDIGQIWRSILNADYFIGSKSEFSRVPAMFTRGEVVTEFEEWALFKNESQKVFANCSDATIFSCQHKWWQTNKKENKGKK